MGSVVKTKSGLFVRQDEGLGLLVFSVYTGLVFLCHNTIADKIKRWLNLSEKEEIEPIYLKTLGPGWAIGLNEAEYPSKHLLPENAVWNIPLPSYPIMINWLLTGKCRNICKYCYAEDLMRGKCKEPSKENIKEIANAILSYNPLAVVLTGGDPLVSEHLDLAIKLLKGKTALILDTGGFDICEERSIKLKNAGVFVRISIDSEIPRVNDVLRPLIDKDISPSHIALKAMITLLNQGVPVGVQTVATKKNRSDLHSFGNKLFRLGVRSWRILPVAKSTTNGDAFKELCGPLNGQARFNDFIQKEIYSRQENGWNKGMGVQIARGDAPNSVVLVSPDGRFLTESRITPGKQVFDSHNPLNPDLRKMLEVLDLHSHVSRYLGL